MKDYSEIFGQLHELPISEEMLGAYLEGNLPAAEEVYMSELIDSDPDLYMIYDLPETEDYADMDPGQIDFPEEEFAILELPDPASIYNNSSDASSGEWMSDDIVSAGYVSDNSHFDSDYSGNDDSEASSDWFGQEYLHHNAPNDFSDDSNDDAFEIGSHDDFQTDC